MTLTDLLVPTYRNMLRMLQGLLDKAEAQLGAANAETLLSARLTPDMWPLAAQLRLAALQAQEAPLRMLGRALPVSLEQLLDEARNGGERPGTLAQARGRIDEALVSLDALDVDALDPAEDDQPIVLDLPNGMTFDLAHEQFARDWALGQFYFHVMAAYSILRKAGVDIGKADYVPHMFGYLRAEAVS
jgi:hypothetical protein